ncbi:MAG: AsmA family protein [Vicinamibacterales bacterium]
MKKPLLIGLAVILIAVAGLAVAVRMLIDPERVRSTIAAQASDALGMPVSLEAASVSIWPRPRVNLSGLKVGEPASLTLDTIEVATALRALLSGRIEDAELTIADSTADLPALLATLDGLAAETPAPPPVEGTPPDAPLTLVSVDTIALRNVRVSFEGGAANVSLDSALDGDRLDIRSFELASDVTNLKASGAIESLASRRGKLSITAETLDLDGMIALLSRPQGAQGAQGAQSAQSAQSAVEPFDLTFDVTAAKGRAGGVQFDNLKTTIHATANAVQMEPFGLGVFDGRVDGKVDINTSKPEPVLVVDAKFSGIDMRAVIAFAGQPEAISGRLAGELHVSGAGSEPAAALASAAGRGAMRITDGAIPNLHLVRAIVLAFGKPAPGSSASGDRFSSIAATMQLANNVVRFSTLSFASPDVDVDGGGTLNLSAGAIDVAGRARLSEALTAQAGRDLVRYTADANRVTVPITVTGQMSTPQVRVDAGAVLRRAAENEMKSQIKKGTEGLLDRLKIKRKP